MGKRMSQRDERSGTHLHLSNGYQKIILYFKTHIPLFLNSLHSRLVKLGPRKTRSWEKGAQGLKVFARNQDHLYNSQIGIEIWFHICRWRILLLKNQHYSVLTRINSKTIRILSKWAKQWLNVERAHEPTYISQMGIKKLFYIFKPIISLLPKSFRSRLVKLGSSMTWSWEKRA